MIAYPVLSVGGGNAGTLSKRNLPWASAVVSIRVKKSPPPRSRSTTTVPTTGTPLGSTTRPVIAAFDGPGVGVGVGDGLGVGTGVGEGVIPGVGVAVGVGVGVGLELELTEPHPVARVKHEASNRALTQGNSLRYRDMKDLIGGNRLVGWKDVQQLHWSCQRIASRRRVFLLNTKYLGTRCTLLSGRLLF